MEWKCNIIFVRISTKSNIRRGRTTVLKNSRLGRSRVIKKHIRLWIEKISYLPMLLKIVRNDTYKVKFGRIFVTWPYESHEINPKWLYFHRWQHKWATCVCRYGKINDAKQIKIMGRLSFQWLRFNVLIN